MRLLTPVLAIATLMALPAFAAEKTVTPEGHEPILASVIDPTPEAYTINVRKLANLGANEDAPTFAVYITGRLPENCGDFRSLELPYEKPEKYKRRFNLSEHKDVITSLEKHGCVVMKNIPSKTKTASTEE